MDCTRARRLLRERDDAAAAERDGALRHLDECPECAALAPALDPVLLFRGLPTLETPPDEAARMREAVAVLRRAALDPKPARTARIALRAAAAAVLVAAALWLAPGPAGNPRRPGVQPAQLTGALALGEYLPSVETLGASPAYVATQVNESDLTLVIVANVDVSGR
jgi:hypothetical protein